MESTEGKNQVKIMIPIVERTSTNIRIQIPYASDNREWIRKSQRKIRIRWDPIAHAWIAPKSKFNEMTERCLKRYGQVYVIQPYNESERCAPACWNATGHLCECSCLGANHGTGQPDGSWFIVSESLAIRKGVARKLLKKI